MFIAILSIIFTFLLFPVTSRGLLPFTQIVCHFRDHHLRCSSGFDIMWRVNTHLRWDRISAQHWITLNGCWNSMSHWEIKLSWLLLQISESAAVVWLYVFLGNSKILAKLDYPKNWQKRHGKSTTTTSNPSMHTQQNTKIQFWPPATFPLSFYVYLLFLSQIISSMSVGSFGEKKSSQQQYRKTISSLSNSIVFWEEKKSRKSMKFRFSRKYKLFS